MKSLLGLLFVLLPLCSAAQKFGYVDTKYILEKMEEYQEAQAEIDRLSVAWQKEIQGMYTEVEAAYARLNAEKVLLTDEMYEKRLEKIKEQEKEVEDYQQQVFGFEGLFFLKQQELMAPVQTTVYDAVEKVCRQERLSIMFDKAGELVMLYTDPVHDYTDLVLDELGLGEKSDQIE